MLYLEGLTAQPGNYDHERIQQIFWQESEFGAGLTEFCHRFQATGDKKIALMARIIVPREAVGESTG